MTTGRDKKVPRPNYTMTARLERILADPEKTVLVIIDMVNDFCSKSGEHFIGQKADALISTTRSLLDKCRKNGVKTIFVRPSRLPTLPEFTIFGRKPHLLEGTWSVQIIEKLKPTDEDYVVKKSTHDCFYQTEMDGLLKKLNIDSPGDNVIVTGVATNICVYHAILGFHVRDYRVIVPSDCTAASPPSMQKLVTLQLKLPGYKYNVILTNSKQISFKSNPESIT